MKTITLSILIAATALYSCKKKEKTSETPSTPTTPVQTVITSDIVVPTYFKCGTQNSSYDLFAVVMCEGYELDNQRVVSKKYDIFPSGLCEIEGNSLNLKFKTGKKNTVEIRKSYLQQNQGKLSFIYNFSGNSHTLTFDSANVSSGMAGKICSKDTLAIEIW